MAKPWEQYQTRQQADGPWTQYQQAESGDYQPYAEIPVSAAPEEAKPLGGFWSSRGLGVGQNATRPLEGLGRNGGSHRPS